MVVWKYTRFRGCPEPKTFLAVVTVLFLVSNGHILGRTFSCFISESAMCSFVGVPVTIAHKDSGL